MGWLFAKFTPVHQLRNQLHSQALNDKKDSTGNEQQEVTLFQRKATTINALLVQQNFKSVLLSEPCSGVCCSATPYSGLTLTAKE